MTAAEKILERRRIKKNSEVTVRHKNGLRGALQAYRVTIFELHVADAFVGAAMA